MQLEGHASAVLSSFQPSSSGAGSSLQSVSVGSPAIPIGGYAEWGPLDNPAGPSALSPTGYPAGSGSGDGATDYSADDMLKDDVLQGQLLHAFHQNIGLHLCADDERDVTPQSAHATARVEDINPRQCTHLLQLITYSYLPQTVQTMRLHTSFRSCRLDTTSSWTTH